MEINSLNSIANIQTSNAVQKTADKVSFGELKKDDFKTTQYSETLRGGATKLFGKTSRYEGTINAKDTVFEVENDRIFFSKKSKIKGFVGEKPIEITVLKQNRTLVYSGTFNGKEINLETSSKFLQGEFIKGSIGEEAIDIKVPGSQAPTDKDTVDVLTLIASLKGRKFTVKNGEFQNYQLSEQAAIQQQINNNNNMMALAAQQDSMNQMNQMNQINQMNQMTMMNNMQMPGMM